MSEPAVLALDLGTTSVRALVVDARGRVEGRAQLPLQQTYPQPGWLEQDADEFLAASIAVMRDALHRGGRPASEVRGLGIVSQRSTAIAWNGETGQALAPAIGWQDRRNQARVDELVALGIPINTLASATKFEWMLRELPAVRAAADAGTLRLGTPDAWLSDRLCRGGAFVTDPGHAACTGLLEAGTRSWWSVALGLFGIDEAWLPQVVATNEIVGETDAAVLGAAIPLAARAGDQQASSFAQGILEPGMAKLTLGTSAMLNLHLEKPGVTGEDGFYALPLWALTNGEMASCVEGTVITAGSAIEWFCELGLLEDAQALDAVAGACASSEGVVVVPALQGLGSPYLDVEARAAIVGLTRGSGRPQLARALIEGIAHRCVDLCDALPLSDDPLRIDGGLAQSEVLAQTLADTLGRPVLRAAEVETTALGAARFAGLATGLWSTPEEALATLDPPTKIDPRLEAGARQAARRRWALTVERVRSPR